jgi:hypothetical protein
VSFAGQAGNGWPTIASQSPPGSRIWTFLHQLHPELRRKRKGGVRARRRDSFLRKWERKMNSKSFLCSLVKHSSLIKVALIWYVMLLGTAGGRAAAKGGGGRGCCFCSSPVQTWRPSQRSRGSLCFPNSCREGASDGGSGSLDLAKSLELLQGDGIRLAGHPAGNAAAAKKETGKVRPGTDGKEGRKVPRISWGSSKSRDYLWGESAPRSCVKNDQGFPLLLLEGVLEGKSLSEALRLVSRLDRGEAELIEQHERTVGVPMQPFDRPRDQSIRYFALRQVQE